MMRKAPVFPSDKDSQVKAFIDAADLIERDGLAHHCMRVGNSYCALGALTVSINKTHCSRDEGWLWSGELPRMALSAPFLSGRGLVEWSDKSSKDEVVAGLRAIANAIEKGGWDNE